MSEFVELAGFACLVVFAWFCWPPAALAAGGLALLVTAQSLPGVDRTRVRRWVMRRRLKRAAAETADGASP